MAVIWRSVRSLPAARAAADARRDRNADRPRLDSCQRIVMTRRHVGGVGARRWRVDPPATLGSLFRPIRDVAEGGRRRPGDASAAGRSPPGTGRMPLSRPSRESTGTTPMHRLARRWPRAVPPVWQVARSRTLPNRDRVPRAPAVHPGQGPDRAARTPSTRRTGADRRRTSRGASNRPARRGARSGPAPAAPGGRPTGGQSVGGRGSASSSRRVLGDRSMPSRTGPQRIDRCR